MSRNVSFGRHTESNAVRYWSWCSCFSIRGLWGRISGSCDVRLGLMSSMNLTLYVGYYGKGDGGGLRLPVPCEDNRPCGYESANIDRGEWVCERSTVNDDCETDDKEAVADEEGQ